MHAQLNKTWTMGLFFLLVLFLLVLCNVQKLIKIDKVDKTSPLHPNVLIGKIITVENDYAKIVTKFGRVNTYISTNRLNKCTATNINFDYSKEIAFSAACKKAAEQ